MRKTPVALAETCVLIYNCVHDNLSEKVALKPTLYKIDVFGVSVTKDHCILSVLVDKEDLKFATSLRMQIDVVRVHRESRNWRLKQHFRNESLPHY